jgi:hypothetical protein
MCALSDVQGLNPQVFKKADISEAIWSMAPAGGLLRLRQHDKVTVNFHGFTKADEARLRSELANHLELEMKTQAMDVSGHNWGQLAVHGSSVAFEVGPCPGKHRHAHTHVACLRASTNRSQALISKMWVSVRDGDISTLQ